MRGVGVVGMTEGRVGGYIIVLEKVPAGIEENGSRSVLIMH